VSRCTLGNRDTGRHPITPPTVANLIRIKRTALTDPTTPTEERWLTPGVRGIGAASQRHAAADLGAEVGVPAATSMMQLPAAWT
jgi:hypothetical protein